MKPLIACSTCSRYIRTNEAHCPFCSAAIELTPARAAEQTPGSPGEPSILHGSNTEPTPTRRSRAAAYAMRTALLASAASAAVACGGEGGGERGDGSGGARVSGNGGASASSATTQGGAAANAGSVARGGSASNAAGGSGNPAGTIELGDAGVAPDSDDGGYAPIPIYGGVFPDPMTRARV